MHRSLLAMMFVVDVFDQTPTIYFFFSSRRLHTRCLSDWSSDVCSSDPADELDEKFRKESTDWEAADIQVERWAWESHERAELEVYGAFPEKIGIEPDLKLKSCAENNHMGKRMFEKHLAIGEAY